MSVNGSGVMLAGQDPLMSLALKRSGLPLVAEVSQAELLFGTIDRCHPSVLVLVPGLQGTFDWQAIVSNLTWLFPDLPVIMVGPPDGQDPGQIPAGWRVCSAPADYRGIVETVRQVLANRAAGGHGETCPHPGPAGAVPLPTHDLPLPAQLQAFDEARVPLEPPVRSAPFPASPQGEPRDRGRVGQGWHSPAETVSDHDPTSGKGSAGTPIAASRAWARGDGQCESQARGRGDAASGQVIPWAWGGSPFPQVVTVCSPKGGVGKTFVAVNVAAALSSRSRAEVLLIDWDLPSADVSIHLNLRGGPGILELINSGREMGTGALREHLVRHPASGMYVLRGPSRPELAEFVGQDHLRSILACARGCFPMVVIDTAPSPCDEALCQALEGCTRILLVVVQDPACLYQARAFLDLLPRLGVNRNAVVLVVNRYRDGHPDARDIGAFLDVVPAALLPDDPGAARAIMQGVPYVLHHSGPLATAIMELAYRLCPSEQVPSRPRERGRRGWFARRVSPGR